MNFLKKLTGLFVFVLAVAGAVAVSRYFSGPRPVVEVEAPPPPPSPPTLPMSSIAPREPQLARENPPASVSLPQVSFKARLVTLDFTTKKSHVTLELEPGPAARTPPPSVWAWVSFFSPEEGGRCEAGPVEVRQPFARGRRATVVVEADASRCSPPRAPAATVYARVNVSADSSAAARLAESELSADLTKATPVVLSGARR